MRFSKSVELENEFSDRFCFWHGASGTRYIHSVYTHKTCPPLPGSIYVVVRRSESGQRTPVRIGRFSPLWDFPLPDDFMADGHEIHVHLLAASEMEIAAAYDDLESGLMLDENRDITEQAQSLRNTPGFTERQLPLFEPLAA